MIVRFRRSELSLDIAALRLRRKAGADSLQREGFAGIKADPRRLDLVAWRKQACAFSRGFERFARSRRRSADRHSGPDRFARDRAET